MKAIFRNVIGWNIRSMVYSNKTCIKDKDSRECRAEHIWEKILQVAMPDTTPIFDRCMGMRHTLIGLNKTCVVCGEQFKIEEITNVGCHPYYDTADGNLHPGDMYWWHTDWYKNYPRGWNNDDGKHLMVVCPDGWHWDVDSRASNCTMTEDRVHRCWVRHGDPEKGIVHVDKNGLTCAAGAGSIQTPTWHGFLHNGELTP